MICTNCGKEMEENQANCPSCGAEAGAVSDTLLSTQPEKPYSPIASLPGKVAMGLLVVINGAVMMLIALALDLYTIRPSGDEIHRSTYHVSFDTLTDAQFVHYASQTDSLNWFGIALPLILVIVFASAAILSAAYSSVTGRLYKRLWFLLGLLSAGALLANLLYFLVFAMSSLGSSEYDGYSYSYYVTPHVGWALAFVGAIAVVIGSWKLKADLE